MTDDRQVAHLRSTARELTAADLSILKAALADVTPERPTLLTTTPGSNNDRLWSEMVAMGWMSRAPQLDVPVPSQVYAVNFAACDRISEFLADLAHADAMTAAINELRATVPRTLIEAVHAHDGRPYDLAMLLAAIVEGTMRRAIKPELHDEFLREVARMAQEMRSL
jgi:hypothetical protein